MHAVGTWVIIELSVLVVLWLVVWPIVFGPDLAEAARMVRGKLVREASGTLPAPMINYGNGVNDV